MQFFNFVNARKLGARELNVFRGFFNNPLFLAITGIIFVVQMLLVQYGGMAVRAVPLTFAQNTVCITIGAFGLLWGLLMKLVLPPSWFASI
jgi:hypothetical protein